MKPLPLKFLKSCAQHSDLPEDNGFEVITSGYSNVGKSSLINAISNTKNLAKCSKTPGRTQLFNIFTIDEKRRLLDLPGYGFAKVSGKKQQGWADQFTHYLSVRKSLQGVIVVTDIRRGLRLIDHDLIEFCHQNDIPLGIILNKSDKLSKQQALKAQQVLLNTINIEKDKIILTSCSKKTGIEDVINLITTWLDH